MVTVETRAHRILKRLSRYHEISNFIDEPYANLLSLRVSEKVIGIYKNNNNSFENNVLISTKGIYILQEKSSMYIDFNDIRSVNIDSKEELNLNLILTNNVVRRLLVSGKKGKFRDALEFLRFLNRVKSDISKH